MQDSGSLQISFLVLHFVNFFTDQTVNQSESTEDCQSDLKNSNVFSTFSNIKQHCISLPRHTIWLELFRCLIILLTQTSMTFY